MRALLRRIIRVASIPLLLGGCGGSEEAYREPPPPPIPPPYIVRDSIPAETPMSFRVQSDTVAPEVAPGATRELRSWENPDIRYMVQIGSYRNASSAADIQARARERYGMPVVNDFNRERGLYQIRIGFFATREAALELRNRLAREYPADYGDAWVVRLMP